MIRLEQSRPAQRLSSRRAGFRWTTSGIQFISVSSSRSVVRQQISRSSNHEMNWRAGTENVIEIVGLGKACQLIHQNLAEYQAHMGKMRDQLESGLLDRFPSSRVNGHLEKRLPNTTSISFKNLEANRILAGFDGVAASAGAACHSDRVDVSSVLEAMNVPLEYAMGTIRFSVGRFTTVDEIKQATEEISRVVADLTPAHQAG